MKTIHIYSDESRHRAERFLFLSGLWIEEKNVALAEQEIKILRHKSGYKNSQGKHIDFLGEFKWTKVSDKYFSVYQQLVDVFFDWIKQDKARFCSMLVDTQNPEVIKHSNIKKEGYFKLLYQLYFHNSKMPAIYKIFPDKITNPKQHKVDFKKLNECLDTSLYNKFKPLLNPQSKVPVSGFMHSITPLDSKKSSFIQIVDVAMGALGYFQNRLFTKPKTKQAKRKLMNYVLNKLILNGAIMFSGKKFMVARSTKFNIWIFKPKNHLKKDG